MTAKEILRKSTKKHRCNGLIGAGSLLENSIIEAMEEYVLHIAERAVEEERKLRQAPLYENTIANSVINSILSRIKQLTSE